MVVLLCPVPHPNATSVWSCGVGLGLENAELLGFWVSCGSVAAALEILVQEKRRGIRCERVVVRIARDSIRDKYVPAMHATTRDASLDE